MEQEHTRRYISDTTRRGYLWWAVPLVKVLQSGQYPVLEEVIYKITMWRVDEVAYQMGQRSCPSYLGKLVRLIGEPLCFMIGLFVQQKDWSVLDTAYDKRDA